jgi:Flp pilus assembly pilin Flp
MKKRCFADFWKDRRASVAIEYVMIAVAVVTAIAAIIYGIGDKVADMYLDVRDSFFKFR